VPGDDQRPDDAFKRRPLAVQLEQARAIDEQGIRPGSTVDPATKLSVVHQLGVLRGDLAEQRARFVIRLDHPDW
jgi:hypothetical protein